MDDADFDDLLDQYLDGTLAPNLEMADVEIVWIDDNPNFGALHMMIKHNVRKNEVEEVLLEPASGSRGKESKGRLKKNILLGGDAGGTAAICRLRRPTSGRRQVLDTHYGI